MNFCIKENQRRVRLYSTVRVEKEGGLCIGRVTLLSSRGVDIRCGATAQNFFVKWRNVREVIEE